MAYHYYCTYCGRELSQENVLFDMLPVLTGSMENAFQILKFRMTKDELEALIASGTPGDQGFVRCELTLNDIMRYVGNAHNLNDPKVESLTIQNVRDYVSVVNLEKEKEEEEEEEESLVSLEGEEEESEPEKEQTPQEEDLPAAILALEGHDKQNSDKYYTKSILRRDLGILNSAFQTGDKYGFEVKRKTERDNDGRELLIGYHVNAGVPKHITIVENRQCCYCEKPVFEHAGTAEHRAVAFIGDQKAGKTSTIVALSHYAKNAIRGAMETDKVWGGSSPIPAVKTIELLSPSPRLVEDLKNYQRGIAPEKTRAEETNTEVKGKAYSATFRIKNSCQEKHYLLTLIDLPGELCHPDTGRIDGNKVLNTFPVALAGDVFVLCFDSSTALGGDAITMIDNACTWANDFQLLREIQHRPVQQDNSRIKLKKEDQPAGMYAPVMVIFNKCVDLERPQKDLPLREIRSSFDRIATTYMFDQERRAIEAAQGDEQNQVYHRLGKGIEDYASLKDAYHARLRCSPYGFEAPSAEKVKEDERLLLDPETGESIYPKPKNIDALMRWLLEVSGCIPSQAQYRSGMTADSPVYKPENNLVTRAQYRSTCPSGSGKDGDVREALLRCYLFENPGTFDKEFLWYYDQWPLLTTARVKSKFMKN